MKEIDIDELLQADNFMKISSILEKHRNFLKDKIKPALKEISDNNREIFRREPDARVKSLASIHRKLNNPKISGLTLFTRLNKIEDLAGARLTIATKDQFKEVDKLLRNELKCFGDIMITRKPISNNIKKTNGYDAVHYLLTNKQDGVKCEIQIRTLTQDLWAVFSHYEDYKSEHDEVKTAELCNYSKLMDVADDYAQIIRKKKISDSNNHHRKACNKYLDFEPDVSKQKKKITTIKILTFLDLEKFFIKEANLKYDESTFQMKKFEVKRLCEVLIHLSDYKVYTTSDLKEFSDSKKYKHYIANHKKLKLPKNKKIGLDISDAFYVLCMCRNKDRSAFKNDKLETPMKTFIDGLLTTLVEDFKRAEKLNGA